MATEWVVHVQAGEGVVVSFWQTDEQTARRTCREILESNKPLEIPCEDPAQGEFHIPFHAIQSVSCTTLPKHDDGAREKLKTAGMLCVFDMPPMWAQRMFRR